MTNNKDILFSQWYDSLEGTKSQGFAYKAWCAGWEAALKPPKREWVGLTLDDMPETYAGDKSFLNIAKWAEAKLKEKNSG